MTITEFLAKYTFPVQACDASRYDFMQTFYEALDSVGFVKQAETRNAGVFTYVEETVVHLIVVDYVGGRSGDSILYSAIPNRRDHLGVRE